VLGDWSEDVMSAQRRQTIFITGTSSRLGRAAARLFASREWTVIAGVQHPEKETALAKCHGILPCALDVSDRQQIANTVARVMVQSGVDVVFNIAGFTTVELLETSSAGQLVRMLNTILMGPIRTTKAFLSFFQERMSGLFINTISIGGPMTAPPNSMYHAIKLALEEWSERMAVELNQSGIGMKIVDPARTDADLWKSSFDLATHDEEGELAEPKQLDASSTFEQIAEAVYEAATDGRNQVRYVVGVNAPLTRGFRLPMETQSSPRPLG